LFTSVDQIALPDFSAGAMENWGLITYRETALLYNPASSSNGDKEWIATVISHELAHMWFGNLVTMKWWNDLWLNEGFASYVSYLGANSAEPTWNVTDLIVLKEVHGAMSVDALASSHPLSAKEEDIVRPAQISELFDTITYSKGAAVLRMLSEFLTEPVFARGLSEEPRARTRTSIWSHKGSEDLISLPNGSQATSGEHVEGCAAPREMPPHTMTDPPPNRSCWRMLQAAERSPRAFPNSVSACHVLMEPAFICEEHRAPEATATILCSLANVERPARWLGCKHNPHLWTPGPHTTLM
ncbi:aminopeptidase N-like, partial [Oncorhynchus nerka]|uniref:aminopeptidase N-like n=1 Tax=Oncorhynchus nerka TaxID=8023 RepID=UPI0031B82434